MTDTGFPAYEACIRCGKGDTNTAFGIHGSALFHCAVLMKVGGWTQEQAMASIVRDLEAEGADLEEARGAIEACVRLCRKCAAERAIRVAEFSPTDSHHTLPGLQEAR